jgi:leader peptidase (prepilin peptidase)/N-methyltransferase
MGIGDVKLVFVLGLFLGRSVIVAVIVGLLSVVVPTIAALPSKGLRARKMHLALGPFLALGGLVALLAGEDIIAWYTGD